MKTLIGILPLVMMASISSAALPEKVKIVCLGDSITEGYGVNRDQAYPALLQKKFDEKYPGAVEVVNAGISGSTTASAASRMKWFLKSKPYLIFLALGANDGLRGIDVEATKTNLENVVIEAKKAGIQVVLGGMKLPPNYGPAATKKFNLIYPGISKRQSVPLVPFILEGVGGDKALNIEDGIHPNPNGHEKVAALIFPFLDAAIQPGITIRK